MKNISVLKDIIKSANKSVKNSVGVSIGFHDPDTWISTGNYALNYRISGDFKKGIPLGKVAVFAGESGSGKSYIVSGNIIKEAQKQGIHVAVFDSENALDDSWLTPLGVDTSEDKLTKINAAMIDDVAIYMADFIKKYRDAYENVPREDRLKILFVIDSLGMLMTPTDKDQFDKGDMKGDMGRKAKMLKALITNLVNTIGALNIGLVCTNHTYESQDMFSPDPKVSGGSGFVYASSILVAMGKLKLKEDEDGNKISDVTGIRAKCKVMKTRYNKPFEDVEIKIPYNGGMNPRSGLLEMFEKSKLIVQSGNSLVYVDIDTGEQIKKFRKAWAKNDDGCLDLVMEQFTRHPLIATVTEEEFGTEDVPDNLDDIIDGSTE